MHSTQLILNSVVNQSELLLPIGLMLVSVKQNLNRLSHLSSHHVTHPEAHPIVNVICPTDSLVIYPHFFHHSSLAFVNTGSQFWDLPSAVFQKLVTALRNDPNVQSTILRNNPNFFGANAATCFPLDASPTPEALNAKLPRIRLIVDKDAGIALDMPAAYGYLRPMDRSNQYWCPSIRNGGNIHSLGLPFLNSFVVKVDRTVTPNVVSFAASAGCFNVPGNAPGGSSSNNSYFVLQIVLLCLVIGGTIFFAIFLFIQHRRR
jgi:hypothetical protein